MSNAAAGPGAVAPSGDDESSWGPLRKLAIASLRLATLGTLLVVLSLVPMHPLSLLEHFRLQLLFGSAALAALAALGRLVVWFDLAALSTVLALVLVTPGLSGARNVGPADGVRVRLLLANVLTSNRDVLRLEQLIEELSPDLIALVEPNRTWFARLAPALAGYPGRIEIHNEANFGIALYARGRVRGGGERLGSAQVTIVATVELAAPSAAPPLSVVVTHPLPPMDERAAQIQARHLAAVAQRIRELPSPVILAGDFNTTPWARQFAALTRDTGLVDTRRGFGAHPTYPAFPEAALLRIPIDHVLVSPSIGVATRRVERDIGSDHLPVFVELVVPRRAPR